MNQENKEKNTFIKSNIEKINNPKYSLDEKGIKLFGSTTELKYFLKENFLKYISLENNCKTLLNKLENENYSRVKIKEIANVLGFNKTDLEDFYEKKIHEKQIGNVNKELLLNVVLEFIENSCDSTEAFKFIKTNTKRVLSKQLDFLGSIGFPENIQQINSGVMTANAGDSAQFLFLARAILAGFNCSNVDVRSSRYDAVIDIKGKLIRVQIKGVTANTISFKDRDRGGQGIDHTHIRNKGKRITSKDCDIYVAVDKEVGLCYILPMLSFVDKIAEKDISNVNLSSLGEYLENWKIISNFK